MEVWGTSNKNAVIFTGQFIVCIIYELRHLLEPGFDYLHALAPYQPLNMKVCVISLISNEFQRNIYFYVLIYYFMR